MATADLTVISLGRAEASAASYIAEIQRRLAAQDRVGYVMHAMGTSLEGPTDDVLALVREHGVLGTVMTVSVGVALLALGVWFFLLAEGGGI